MDISLARLCVLPPPQAIAGGFCLLRNGVILLKRERLKDERLIIDGSARKLVAVAFLIAGSVSIYLGVEYFVKTSTDVLISRYFVDNLKDLENEDDLKELDPYEQKSMSWKALPARLLFLSVGREVDYNGVQNPLNSVSAARILGRAFGFRYKVIFNRFQICREIQKLSKSDTPYAGLVLGGHGNSLMMRLSLTTSFVIFDSLPKDCFNGLNEKGKIFLESCKTGQDSWIFPNLAEWISWISKREVVAATCSINSIAVLNQPDLYEQFYLLNNTDIDIRLLDDGRDCTAFFNTATVGIEKAVFFAKVANTALVGVIITWQALRLGASVLKGSGAATLWLVDKSAPPIKKIANLAGVYHSGLGNVFYYTTKIAGNILNITGSRVHQGMDNTVNWVFKKGSDSISYIVSTIFGRCKRGRV